MCNRRARALLIRTAAMHHSHTPIITRPIIAHHHLVHVLSSLNVLSTAILRQLRIRFYNPLSPFRPRNPRRQFSPNSEVYIKSAMPSCFFSCRLGPRIEVYRNQSRPLHVEDGAIHVRRHPGYRDVSVFVRRRPSHSSSIVVPRCSSAYRPRYRSPSPTPEPRIIEIEPSDSYQRRYRSPAPSPEPTPRQHYHSHFHQQVPVPAPAPAPTPAPAPPPPPPPPPVNPLGEKVETLAARNAALEAEMRELREQFRAARIREETTARVREEMEMRPRRWRECDCGHARGDGCRCDWGRSARRERRYSSDVDFEVRPPRWEGRPRRGSVRWVDEVDWD